MKKEYFKINGIPCIQWGHKSNKVVFIIHGIQSHKEDLFIRTLADILVEQGYQLLSFDLPEHGDRKNETIELTLTQCAIELKGLMIYCKNTFDMFYLCACSYGVALSLMNFSQESFVKCCFLSPVLDLKELTERLLSDENLSIKELKVQNVITLKNGIKVKWQDYKLLQDFTLLNWCSPTTILYGSKDLLVPFESILNFCHTFDASCTISPISEHYFHTDEDCERLRQWISIEFNVVI
jgi:hypothetical protein